MSANVERQSNKKRWFFVCIAVILAVMVAFSAYWTVHGSATLEVNEYVIQSERLPTAFDGYKIAQISDLHNAEFGEGNEKLLAALKNTAADAIVLTGDLVDARRTDVGVALRFAEKAVEIAPTYYVTGNHEMRISEYADLKTGLLDCGVTVLENEAVMIEKAGEHIRFVGLKDPACVTERDADVAKSYIQTKLKTFEWGVDYTVLLSHRPELFEVYVETGADLVFSGHAHGGQFRLPKIGGLFAPGQGFFPKYDGGVYEKEQTKMLVSRGLGNSLFPFRVNNNPEIVVAVLRK